MSGCNDILEAETAFGLRLLASFPGSGSKVFSPLSISFALALIHSGARGRSKSQIENALIGSDKDTDKDEEFLNHFSQIVKEIQEAKANGVEVNVANRVFTSGNHSINPDYLDKVQRFYQAAAVNLDFKRDEAARVINTFVEDETSGKITDFISPDIIKDAVALLVNAVHFKADWLEKFDKDNTLVRDFHGEEGIRKIPFLNEYGAERDFTEDDTFQVLSLPYEDPKFSFVIFLPKERFGLKDALKKLTGSYFQSLLSDLKNSYVNIHIPKMHISTQLSLQEPLEAIGITDIFSYPAADLSAIAPGVWISSGVHKSMIDVDEEGTTAAAASGFDGKEEMAEEEDSTDFLADHPFLFAVLHDKRPVFLGIHA